MAKVGGVEVGTLGHDIADRLSGRLYQLAQLYFEKGAAGASGANVYQSAEELLLKALELSSQNNNVLGYASRLGLLCRIHVLQERFEEANSQITKQLQILRERVLHQEHLDTEEEA